MKTTVDINCDVGEGIGNERELMPYISSCSIACGAHAGDDQLIEKTVQLALQHQVKIGAHPSFPDKENFGRQMMDIDPADLQLSTENQIILVKDMTERLGGELHHIKAHGALYNVTAVNREMAQLFINVVKNTAPNVFLYVPYNSVIQELALENNLKIKIEAFADRNYNADLTLVSRKNENALITDKDILIQHLLKMIKENKLIAIDGVEVEIKADTFCVHGDNQNAINILKYITKKLQENGIKIA